MPPAPPDWNDADDDIHENSRIATSLWHAHRAAVSSLADPAQGPVRLIATAEQLGRVLRDAANSDRFWQDLTTHEATTDRDHQLTRETLESVDFSVLLLQLGYAGPPPASLLSERLRSGMRQTASDVDRAAMRDRVKFLGDKLLSLAGVAETDPAVVRIEVRRGARLAGHLAVAVAVAGVTVGTAMLVPHLGLPVLVVTAAGASSAQQFATKLAEQAVDELKRYATAWADQVTQRAEPVARAQGRLDLFDLDARQAFGALPVKDVGRALATWRAVGGLASGRPLITGRPESTKEHDLLEKAISQTTAILSSITASLYDCWYAALGSDWGTDALITSLEAFSHRVADVQAMLREPVIDPVGLVRSLTELNDHRIAILRELHVTMPHSMVETTKTLHRAPDTDVGLTF